MYVQLSRWLFLFLLLAVSSDAAITQGQTKQIQKACFKIQDITTKLFRLATLTSNAISNGNIYSIDFSTQSYSFTSQQQQDVVNYYQSLKAQLQSQIDAMP